MRKVSSIGTGLIASLAGFASTAFAQSSIQISRPAINRNPVGFATISNFIQNAIILVFIVGIVGVLIMMIWGGVQWLFSGGDKDAVAAAQKRIVNALIGLAILAVAYAVYQLAGSFLGFKDLNSFTIPTPSE